MRISKMRRAVLGMGLGLLIAGAARAGATPRGCPASTPMAAPAGIQFQVEPGFAVRRIVTDRMLHQTWAMVEDCSHPEQPLRMIQVGTPISPAKAEPIRTAHTPVAVTQAIPTIAEHASQIIISEPVSSPAPLPQPLLVRAGDRVHLWSASTNVRLEIEAVALDYGHAGQIIHLRRLGNNSAQRVMLAGLVDGADTAELLP